MAQSLTAPERETVIRWSDDEGIATVTTHQRSILTKLEKNPAATKVEDLTYGSSKGARFEIPASLISFRSSKRSMSLEQKAAAAQRMKAYHEGKLR